MVKAPNVQIGEYTYYDSETDPQDFEKNNILFSYPVFGDRLIIGGKITQFRPNQTSFPTTVSPLCGSCERCAGASSAHAPPMMLKG